MRAPDDQGGAEARAAFEHEMVEAYRACEPDANGYIQKDGLRKYFARMHEFAVGRGLHSKAPTDEWLDKAWPCFNNWKDCKAREKNTEPDALKNQ